jgi:heme A synthase
MPQFASPKPTLGHRLLHGWTILTVVASACAIALGSVVTTFKFGMTDMLWPTAPWHLFVIDWTEPSAGYLIEHSHRLAAYTAGFCFMTFAVTCAFFVRTDRRLMWLGYAALVAVIVQGVLGGSRVLLDVQMGRNLALIHGIFAQVVFSLSVAMALFTAPRLNTFTGVAPKDASRALRQSLHLTALAFLQIVFGALLRHTLSPLSQRLHLLGAFFVVVMIVWLARTVFTNPDLRRLLRWPVLILVGLVTIQVMLGVETFLYRFTAATVPDAVPLTISQAAMRTVHVLVGSWILAASVSCAVLAYLDRRPTGVDLPLARRASEGVEIPCSRVGLTAVGLKSDQPAPQNGVEHCEGRA